MSQIKSQVLLGTQPEDGGKSKKAERQLLKRRQKNQNTNTNFLEVIGGHSLVSQKPVFSFDASTLSGKWIHDLKGHSGKITSICRHPHSHSQCFSCGTDDRVILWDFLDGLKLKDITVCKPQSLFMISFGEGGHRIGVISDDSYLNVWSLGIDLSDLKEIEFSKESKMLQPYQNNYAYFPGCHLFCATAISKNAVNVFKMSAKKKSDALIAKKTGFLVLPQEKDEVRSIVAHPSMPTLAVASILGDIFLFFDIENTLENTPLKFSWHALNLNCINFSSLGSTLMSGGDEGVLVFWSMHNPGDKDRNFLPRVRAPIVELATAPGNQVTAACLRNNTIMLVNTDTRNPTVLIQSVVRWIEPNELSARFPEDFIASPSKIAKSERSPSNSRSLILDTTSGIVSGSDACIVMPGMSGYLNWYNPSSDETVMQLDVCADNLSLESKVASEQFSQRIPPSTNASHVFASGTEIEAFDLTSFTEQSESDGLTTWLATIQSSRPDNSKSFLDQRRLKFWSWNEAKANFHLNTLIDAPHESPVNLVRFDVSGRRCLATCAVDGAVKIWKCRVIKPVDEDRPSKRVWSCVAKTDGLTQSWLPDNLAPASIPEIHLDCSLAPQPPSKYDNEEARQVWLEKCRQPIDIEWAQLASDAEPTDSLCFAFIMGSNEFRSVRVIEPLRRFRTRSIFTSRSFKNEHINDAKIVPSSDPNSVGLLVITTKTVQIFRIGDSEDDVETSYTMNHDGLTKCLGVVAHSTDDGNHGYFAYFHGENPLLLWVRDGMKVSESTTLYRLPRLSNNVANDLDSYSFLRKSCTNSTAPLDSKLCPFWKIYSVLFRTHSGYLYMFNGPLLKTKVDKSKINDGDDGDAAIKPIDSGTVTFRRNESLLESTLSRMLRNHSVIISDSQKPTEDQIDWETKAATRRECITDLFQTSCHTLPSMSVLGSQLVSRIVSTNPIADSTNNEEPTPMETDTPVDENSSSEDETPPSNKNKTASNIPPSSKLMTYDFSWLK